MTDKDLSKLYSIPYSNLHKWKNKSKDDWRYKLYTILKHTNEVEVKNIKKHLVEEGFLLKEKDI